MKTIFLLSSFILSFSLQTFAQEKYYGENSTEAILEFDAQIVISTSASSLTQLLKNRNQREEVTAQIDTQVEHLIGHFQSQSFLNDFDYPGVLGSQYEYQLTSLKDYKGNKKLLSYQFKGKTNFQTDAFRSNNVIAIPLRLPLDTDTVYQLGLVGSVNRCTDEHYNSAGDFFYFWDPDMTGCPLKKNNKDVLRFDGTLTLLQNTHSTYPEFDKLYRSNKDLKISIFLGYIDEDLSFDQVNYQDDAMITYRSLIRRLTDNQFKVADEKKAFRRLGNGQMSKGINFLTQFEKTITNGFNQKMRVQVELYLGDTGMNINDPTFHHYLKSAYEKSDLVAYDGHSGLGGNLSLDTLPTINFTNKYQIYFFNGCSSYPYYNVNYMEAKPGHSKNLDIITSGLPTLSSTSYKNMTAFIMPFLDGKIFSYQDLMKKIESSNGFEDTYLMGVNGDEDNSFRP